MNPQEQQFKDKKIQDLNNLVRDLRAIHFMANSKTSISKTKLIDVFMSFDVLDKYLQKQPQLNYLKLTKPQKQEDQELYNRQQEYKNYIEDASKIIHNIQIHLSNAIELADKLEPMSQLKDHIQPTKNVSTRNFNPKTDLE